MRADVTKTIGMAAQVSLFASDDLLIIPMRIGTVPVRNITQIENQSAGRRLVKFAGVD